MMNPNNMSVFVHTLMFVMNQSNFQNQDESYNYYLLEIGKNYIPAHNLSKCYGSYGCYKLSPPWTSEHRPVSLFPEPLEKIEPRFPYYTRKHPTGGGLLDLNEYDVFGNTDIDPLKNIYLVAHGFMEGGGIFWILETVKELLDYEDCSVIVVDWAGGSAPPYTQAVANIRLVGAVTAHLLTELASHTGRLKLDHVHCIGHSLGAHMCAYASYNMQNDANLTLGRITGLDPAEPHFAKAQRPVRLDRSAAHYVDVVHTDASQFIRGGLGMTEKIGHVDYFPNGGNSQPGCGNSVSRYIDAANGSLFMGMRKYLGCNHLKSHEFFGDSINPNRGCSFMSVACANYEDFLAGKCFDCGRRGEKCVKFGFHGRKDYDKLIKRKIISPQANLVQYLFTGDNKPYCRAHYRITIKMSMSDVSVRNGGEIGQVFFTMHSTTDGKGPKTLHVPLNTGIYHEPGKTYVALIPTNQIPRLKAVEAEFVHTNSFFNPLTWRFLVVPQIYVDKITVDALEIQQSVTVCTKDRKSLQSGRKNFMTSSYCL